MGFEGGMDGWMGLRWMGGWDWREWNLNLLIALSIIGWESRGREVIRWSDLIGPNRKVTCSLAQAPPTHPQVATALRVAESIRCTRGRLR